MKHPIILHCDSPLACLIMLEAHITNCHSSFIPTLDHIRSRFYIVRVRAVIQSVLKTCVTYKKTNARPVVILMAPLTAYHLMAQCPPFHSTGIDYFGPLVVAMQRKTAKRHGVIFTCLTTRAVHLELTSSLDTNSFMLTFMRFGRPEIVYSKGTNLVACEKGLREVLASFPLQLRHAGSSTEKPIGACMEDFARHPFSLVAQMDERIRNTFQISWSVASGRSSTEIWLSTTLCCL